MSHEKLRVAYLVSYYPAVTHTFITREIDRLKASGVEVSVFSLHRAPAETLLTDADRHNAAETSVVLPPPVAEFVLAHIRAVASRPRVYLDTLRHSLSMGEGGARHKLWQFFYFAEAVLLWHRLRVKRISHVHAHFGHSGCSVALLAAELGLPEQMSFSFTMHGPTEFDEVVRHALAEKVRCATFVACIGYYCRSQLMKLVDPGHWPKLQIVRCGVEISQFEVIATSSRSAAGPLNILSIGRLVPDKGQSILLHACARMVAECVDVHLTLVGVGGDRWRLEKLAERLGIAGRVAFAGAVGQDRIRDLYAAADVFCLPSFAEGIPVVLMEAMASGRPVVATQIMGIPELVEDQRSGLLVAPGDVDGLVAALKRIAADADLAARLVAAGRARVESEYSLEQSTARLLDLFAEAAATGGEPD